jgi:hypothetical protein
MSMKLSLNQLRLLVFVILSLSQVIYCNEPQESVCDDGKQYLEKDLAASIRCEDDESWSVSTYMKPAGQHFCTNETILSGKVCMDAEITYSSSPPLGGHYRPIPPRYGDYRYLPPQRWVHSLVVSQCYLVCDSVFSKLSWGSQLRPRLADRMSPASILLCVNLYIIHYSIHQTHLSVFFSGLIFEHCLL